MNAPTLIFFDTETTGLPYNYHDRTAANTHDARLVQLAYSVYNGSQRQTQHNTIIQPNGFTIPKAAERVHGISTARAKAEGIPLQDALRPFITHLEQADWIIAHNINFDMIILYGELLRGNYPTQRLKHLQEHCTMLPSTDFVGVGWSDYHQSYKWPKLSELAERCNISYGSSELHNALYDLELLEQCYFSQAYQRAILGAVT